MSEFPKAVSVVMRCFNEAWAVGETIRSLQTQDFEGEIELIVIDSGSSDGSIEKIKAAAPTKLIQIPLGTYVPGMVMNRGAREASHDWIIYLNADATPVGREWLKELITPCLDVENFGAGFSRQIPRPDCLAVFAHDYDRCFGPQRESAQWGHFFSMVSSITHRSVLADHPFREDLQYAEDDEWTRRLAATGYQIVYVEKSIVMHSHNYTFSQVRKRSRGDAIAVAKAGHAPAHGTNFIKQVILGSLRDAAKDVRWCLKNGQLPGLPRAGIVRLFHRYGSWEGFRAGKS